MPAHYYFVQETIGLETKTLVHTNIFANLEAALIYGRSLLTPQPNCHQVEIIDSRKPNDVEYVLISG